MSTATTPAVGKHVAEMAASASTRGTYLSLKQWAPSDGFVDAAALLNVTSPRPIFMANSEPLMSTLDFLAKHERNIIRTMQQVFRTHCKRDRLFLDSGANDGFWSMLAASYNCGVIAVEPQAHCIDLLRAALERNRMRNNVTLLNRLLAAGDAAKPPMKVPIDQCHGTAQFLADRGVVSDATGYGRRIRKGADARQSKTRAVPFVSVDSLVDRGQTIALWHLDVEGAEPFALRGAAKAIRERRVQRLLMEVMPSRWQAHGLSLQGGLDIAANLLRGWECITMCEPWPRFSWTTKSVHSNLETGRKSICQDVYCVGPGKQRTERLLYGRQVPTHEAEIEEMRIDLLRETLRGDTLISQFVP